ncbi:MAG: mandelate racemase/muconate lactonizing enzyme family protein, partial [Hyphomicrobiaceae bacterium]
MKITKITSHVLQYDLPELLGYSQQYYSKRSAHLVEVETDEGVTGWGECFGPGNVALANKTIVERVIAPMIMGDDPLDRDVIWHKVYNLLRDHGQKGMPLQSLSGVDIALWDIAGKAAGLPLHKLIGGAHRNEVAVYGYGMMLRREPANELAARFKDEAAAIRDMGFVATKMKVGLGPKDDVMLAQAVRKAVGDDYRFMVDANHCYTTSDAFYVGRALEELDAYWFEEPVAPEDLDGYRELRAGLKVNISGGEAEFNRWGWRSLLESRGLDIAQPEVCALGGISEYLRGLALCHAHFTPVINHVWGSAIAVATSMHLLAAMPPLPGGLHPW